MSPLITHPLPTGQLHSGGDLLVPFKAAPCSLRRVLMACVVLSLAGCASYSSRGSFAAGPKVDRLADLNRPTSAVGMEDRAEGDSLEGMSVSGRSDLIPSVLVESDPLPKFNVPKLSFDNTPLQDVLKAVLVGSNLPLSVVWDNPESKVSRHSVSMSQLGGDLTGVLNRLADSYGFYWQNKDGTLHIAADRQYVTAVPPIADLFESLPIMVKTLGGTDVFLDRSARMITFRADSQSFSKIKGYLDMTRRNRSLIVYDTYIWEVILNDGSKMGIDWGALPGMPPATALTSGAAASGAKNLLSLGLVNAASGGNGLALSLAGSSFSMKVLIEFLRTQGTINSLSQPKIQLLSGGKATLKDEISTTYVARIGNPTISAGTVVPGSVATGEVKTGVTLEVSGDVSDGTIYSDISLRVSDLIGMGSATINGTTITLPKTSSREVNTNVRAKQGDTILLAGIQYDKISNTSTSGMMIERAKEVEALRSELIIILKPRVKSFFNGSSEEKVAVKPAAALVAPVDAPREKRGKPVPVPENVVVPKPATAAVAATAIAAAATAAMPAPTSIGPVVVEAPTARIAPTRSAMAELPPSVQGNTPAYKNVYLQVAAFSGASSAQSYRRALEQLMDPSDRSGPALQVETNESLRDGTSHRLLAGPFPSRLDALQWSERTQGVAGSRPLVLVR